MKYQIVRHNKTGTKQIAVLETLREATYCLMSMGCGFEGLSYIGSFPMYYDKEKNRRYTIQGSVELGNGQSVVCSLPQKELEALK